MKPTLRFATFFIAAWTALASLAFAEPETLRVALQDNPSTLDPALASSVAAIGVSHWLYNGLVTFDDKAHVQPDLATRYTLSPDGRRFTFYLRHGVRFQDGRAFTSADVKYSLTRLLRPETRSPGSSFYRGIVGALDLLSGKKHELAGVEAPSPFVVVIRLQAPETTFLQRLGLNYAAIVPAGAAENPDFAKHPIGTGPFRLEQDISGQRLVFERNAHYFKPGLPHLQRIDVELGLNEQVEALRFERGDLDAIGLLRSIGAADYARLASNPAWSHRFLSAPDMATYYVGMNTRLKPFDDPRVRRAVAMAVDKAKLVRFVNGRGVIARSFLPPGLPGADPTLHGYAYDPARARALLAEAGYPHGFTTTYWCSNAQTALKVAEGIQQDLRLVGIMATLRPLAFPTFLSGVGREGNAAIFTGNWSQDYPDPENFLGTLFTSKAIKPVNSINTTFFRDAEVDRLLDEAAHTLSTPRRFALYHLAERRILSVAPIVPLYHPERFVLAQSWVKGLKLHPVWPIDAEHLEVTRR